MPLIVQWLIALALPVGASVGVLLAGLVEYRRERKR